MSDDLEEVNAIARKIVEKTKELNRLMIEGSKLGLATTVHMHGVETSYKVPCTELRVGCLWLLQGESK